MYLGSVIFVLSHCANFFHFDASEHSTVLLMLRLTECIIVFEKYFEKNEKLRALCVEATIFLIAGGGRRGQRSEEMEDYDEHARPSAPATLFDFVTTIIPKKPGTSYLVTTVLLALTK